MNQLKQSPWKAVLTGILGLVIGYALVVAQHSTSTFAISPQCPAHAGTCTGGDCMKGAICTGADCQHNCPGCSKQPAII